MQHPIESSYLAHIKVFGADAAALLQGQLTQDVRKIDATAQWAGLCSPKGRLLALMRIWRKDDTYWLEMHRSVAEATAKRLRLFVLRSKVTIELHDIESAVSQDAWRQANIDQGIPTIYAETADHFVPQMVNLDLIGGISFSKGCYTGQEIVARLHYLGTLKRRMFRAESHLIATPGMSIYDAAATGQAVGEVVDAIATPEGARLLVVLQLAHASSDLRLNSPTGTALCRVQSLLPA